MQFSLDQVTHTPCPCTIYPSLFSVPQAVLRVVCEGAKSVGVPGFVSKTYLSFYAVLLCEVMAAVPRVTEDMLSLLLPYLVAGLKGDASKEYTSATLMVLTQLLARAQLANAFLQGEQGLCRTWVLLWVSERAAVVWLVYSLFACL
jgi:hypothetical protein